MLIASISSSHAQQLAFPGAEGFGRFTSGGRGGSVIEVTNLNDSGTGSLRAALATQGARTIVFRLSGTITLRSELRVTNGDLTIAGQTAPGEGICLRDYPLIIAADNVIIRYLRVRLGDVQRLQEDAVSCLARKNIIVDHCSLSWGIDEVASFYDNENATVQWCIVSESLDSSFHQKGKHGYAGIWGGKGASFHHNLLAHHSNRNPRFNGSRTHGKPEAECVDFRNNVIYNWRDNSSYGGEAGKHNLVANYFKSGPATGATKNRIVEPYDAKGKWYIAENFVEGFAAITANNWASGVQGQFAQGGRVDAPHAFAPVTTHTAKQAYESVLANAGATFPRRDVSDMRIVAEVQNGTATFGKAGIINSQSEVNGWPLLRSAPAPKDADHDGMPDDWERGHGLDPLNANDRNDDFNRDGYPNLEEYLNTLPQHMASGFNVPRHLCRDNKVARHKCAVQFNPKRIGLMFRLLVVLLCAANHSLATTPHAVVDAKYSGMPGAVVDGAPRFATIAAALASVPQANAQPFVIFIKAGKYDEKLIVDRPHVHLLGESRERTIITHNDFSDKPAPNGGTLGTPGSYTLQIAAPDFRAENLTIENVFDYTANAAKADDDPTKVKNPQAVAVMTTQGNDRATFCNCILNGFQDTLFVDAGRHYFQQCRILGHVDFIFGAGQAVFDKCEIVSRNRQTKEPTGFVAAPSTLVSRPYGFLFLNCRLLKENADLPAGSARLGRPWHPAANLACEGNAVFMNCFMDDHIGPEGYAPISARDSTGQRIWFEVKPYSRFFEYGSHGPGAHISPKRPTLTESEAAYYTSANVLNGWRPTCLQQ